MKGIIYRLYSYLREHELNCKFFDEFGIFVQCTLALICLLALLFKRFIEKPRRPWVIFILDTSKQILGQNTQHFSNLIFASKIGESSGLECEWYLNNLIADCTIGVLFQYLYLQFLIYILQNTRFEFQTGDYGQNTEYVESETCCVKFSWRKYLYQVMWWMVIAMFAKLTVFSILLIFYKIVENFGKLVLAPMKTNPKVKLVMVMIVIPTFFNILQFWFTDNFIKRKDKDSGKKFDDSSTNLPNNYVAIPVNEPFFENEQKKDEKELLV